MGLVKRDEFSLEEAAARLADLVGWPASDIRGYVIITTDKEQKAQLTSNIDPQQIAPLLLVCAALHGRQVATETGPPD